LSLWQRCQRPTDVDRCRKVETTPVKAVVNAFYRWTEVAIYALIAMLTIFVSSLVAPRTPLTLDCGQVFQYVYRASHLLSTAL